MKVAAAFILMAILGFICLEQSNNKYSDCLHTGMSASACDDLAY